jgi:hypothetical protein
VNALSVVVSDFSSTQKLHGLQKASDEQFEEMRSLIRAIVNEIPEVKLPNLAFSQRFLDAFDQDCFLVQRTYNWQWAPYDEVPPANTRTRKGWSPSVRWTRQSGPILRDPREEATEAMEIISWLRGRGEEPTDDELLRTSPRIPRDSVVVLDGREVRFSYGG